MTGSSESNAPADRGESNSFAGSYLISYILVVLLLGSLVYFAGVWNVMANTRLLDLFFSSGIIGYHDVQLGIVEGIPDHKFFLYSQDPIDWRLVGVVAAFYFLF